MPLGYNRILGDSSKPEVSRPHRVALASWPTGPKDRRSDTIDAMTAHASSAGYEGFEFGPVTAARYFPDDSLAAAVKKLGRKCDKAGVPILGSTLHVGDDFMRSIGWHDNIAEQLKQIIDLGGEYAAFQFFIHPDYAGTGGAYRDDERYLSWAAQQVAELRGLTWDHNLNFYLEVHLDRITEDPAALCRILDLATCELNGDMSHYLCRGITRGKHMDKIMSHLGHTHVRMARHYGDLSADVPDPKADWQAKGVTWQMFQLMKAGLEGGISSRAICGETGPMHLVKDTLSLDAKLVPLYRAMARYADASAQGMTIKVDEPGDLQPWG